MLVTQLPAASPLLSSAPLRATATSLECLKTATFQTLADIFASPTADLREKRLAAAVALRYIAAAESRRPSSAASPQTQPNVVAASPAIEQPPVLVHTPAAEPHATVAPRVDHPAYPAPIAPPTRDNITHVVSPASPHAPAVAPLAPPVIPIDSPSLAALLRARAGTSSTRHDPTAPHAGVNFHPAIHSVPQPAAHAPPRPEPLAAPPRAIHSLSAAA